MHDRVVHVREAKFDVYIGRGQGSYWGNPFSHKPFSSADVRVDTREEAVARFKAWLDGEYPEVAPGRAIVIRDNLYKLHGKVLGCWCAPESCHGDVLAQLAENPPYHISGYGCIEVLKRLARYASNRSTKIACIGRRAETLEPEMAALCRQIGRWVAANGMYVGSGNADGCDSEYAAGANEIAANRVILYLPWKTFNREFIHQSNILRVPPLPKEEQYLEMVRVRHPKGAYLKDSIVRLHSRNCAILDNASACIAYPSYKTGGTKFGMDLARTSGTPLIDLSHLDVQDAMRELTKDYAA
jgi:hypothetical protein